MTLYYADTNWQTEAAWKCGIVVSIPQSGRLAQGNLCFEYDFPKSTLMYLGIFPLGIESTPTPDSSVLYLFSHYASKFHGFLCGNEMVGRVELWFQANTFFN